MVKTRAQKRKLDEEDDGLIRDVGDLLNRQLTPSTKRLARELYSTVDSLGDDDDKRWKDAKRLFEALESSADKSAKIRELEKIKKAADHQRWLLEVGDWCSDIFAFVFLSSIEVFFYFS